MLAIKWLLTRQVGQTLVEYACIIALIAIGVLVALQGFGTGLQGLYTTFPAAF